jgi:HEAT repeat protein
MNRRGRAWIVAACAWCAFAGGAAARQSAADVEKALASTDPKARQEAVREIPKLGDAGWSLLFKKALRDPDPRVADEAELVLGELTNTKSVPLLFGKDGLGSGDEWVRLRVAEALGRIEVSIPGKEFASRLDDRAADVRRTLAWSLERRSRAGRVADAEREALIAALQRLAEKDKDPGVRAAASVAWFACVSAPAAGAGRPALTDELRRTKLDPLLADKAWPVRAAAGVCAADLPPALQIDVLERLASDDHPGPRALAIARAAALEPDSDGKVAGAKLLVGRVVDETNQRNRLDAYDALVRLSGFKYPLAKEPWVQWLANPRPYAQRSSEAPLGEYVGVTMTTFAGLRVRSQRVSFLIDLSGSMWQAQADGKTRKQAVDVELGRALAQLTPETQFNVIPYTDQPFAWKKTLQPATAQNVKTALDYFAGCTQHGKGNFWDAWLLALEDPAVDSVVVLTDGAPTGGHRWNLELMRTLIGEQNRFRRVALDAILVDAKGHLAKLWTELCTEQRGTVHSAEL